MVKLPTSLLRLADLATRRPTEFELTPDAATRSVIADTLGIPSVKKLRFIGQLTPLGRTDWQLTAKLGATVVQECVVTLAPVTARIDESLVRTYVAEFPEVEASEVEMPEDDTVEPLPASIDLVQVMVESLSLALPLYPRAEGADLGEAVFSESGIAPMTDDDAKPFAGLGDLRKALEKKGEKGE